VVEGGELSQVYFRSGRISFATATVAANESSPVDPGHPEADEIVYCQEGRILLALGDEGARIELRAGDAVLIHEGVPHRVTALGEPARLVWSAAPSWGREINRSAGGRLLKR
jgi:mannose-6-phosphate isomerase-like protein (cupin superfamily)